jgi:2-aminoadipate transaminase
MTNYRFAARGQIKSAPPAAFPEGTINLSPGFGFPECLPHIGAAAQVAAEKYREESMQYTDTLGIDDMRKTVVAYVGRDGVKCNTENVIVVNGAKHALDLVCRVFLEPDDLVVVTSPTYLTAIKIFKTFQARFLCMPVDEQGLNTDVLESKLLELQRAGKPLPKLLFDVPDFHNPTGITMTRERRIALVNLAKRFGFVIVEDDPYRRIRFEGNPVAPIKSFDDAGVVIALGTAAKILAPGLRVGWAIADPDIILRMAAQKADGGSSAFTQRIFIELLRTGDIDKQVRVLSEVLQRNRDAMIDAFAELMPDAKIRRPAGGYYLWIEMPKDVNCDLLAGIGTKLGVIAYAGTRCFAIEPDLNFFRLSYSYVTPEVSREGVRRLAQAYSQLRKGLDASSMSDASKAAGKVQSY